MYVPPPCPPFPPRAWADKRKAVSCVPHYILYPTLHILYPTSHIQLCPSTSLPRKWATFSQQGYSHCSGNKRDRRGREQYSFACSILTFISLFSRVG